MDHIDSAMLERVWQRVHPEQSPSLDVPLLRRLILQEAENAATYLQLQRVLRSGAGMLRQLYRQTLSHIACLKGIYTHMTGKHPDRIPSRPHRGTAESVLRQCYSMENDCISTYEKLSAHPEYGHVFARLAQQQHRHCRLLMQLLGSMPRKIM